MGFPREEKRGKNARDGRGRSESVGGKEVDPRLHGAPVSTSQSAPRPFVWSGVTVAIMSHLASDPSRVSPHGSLCAKTVPDGHDTRPMALGASHQASALVKAFPGTVKNVQ